VFSAGIVHFLFCLSGATIIRRLLVMLEVATPDIFAFFGIESVASID